MCSMRRNWWIGLLAGALIAMALPRDAAANVYAARLAITNPDTSAFDGDFTDGSDALVGFYLNDTASAVTIRIIDVNGGATVAELDGGSRARGFHAVPWDGTGTQPGGQYRIQVTAEQPSPSTTDWTMIYDSGDIDIFTRGVAVNVNPDDPNFGLTFASNDGGPLGTGINIFNPDGSSHDPFLVAADVSLGGTVDYGTEAPIFAVMDSLGRLYVSNRDRGEILRINRDYSATVMLDSLTFPKGIYVAGSGTDFVMYFAADNKIWRAPIGDGDSYNTSALELIGEFTGFFPHQVMLDDDGALYSTLRTGNGLGDDGAGIRKFDISGTLPVTDNDVLWTLDESRTWIANDLLLDRGADLSSSSDDILYYCTRAGSNNNGDGVWRVNDINSFFPDTVRVITEDAFYGPGADDNINARATMDFDPAGNIILMENSNEHVFFFSPPGDGPTNSYTHTAPDTFTVTNVVGIGDDNGVVADGYRLEGNYPNPFNPTTTIAYALGASGSTTITIYDVLGREVRTLVDAVQPAGQHEVRWDGRNDRGEAVPSGVYIYRLNSGSFTASQRMNLVR